MAEPLSDTETIRESEERVAQIRGALIRDPHEPFVEEAHANLDWLLAALGRVEERERMLEQGIRLARRVVEQINYPTIVAVSDDAGRSIDMWRAFDKERLLFSRLLDARWHTTPPFDPAIASLVAGSTERKAGE